MNKWEYKRIDHLGKIVTGKTPSSNYPEDFGLVYPFITPTDIPNTQKYISTERFLSEKGFETLKNIKLPPKSVCVVCIGATIGKVCTTNVLSVSNQQINSIITNEMNNSDYIYYLSTTVRDTLVSFAGGAATPLVNKSLFSSIKVPVPNISIQRKIAAILSAYDDLIENNNRRIGILEKMAGELYREWFIRFRFPGHEKVKVVKGVPEGWEVKKIGDIISFKYGYTETSIEDDQYPKYLRVMDINKYSYIKWSIVPNCRIDENKKDKYLLKKYDLVIARMASPGKVAIIERDINAVFASYLIKMTIDQNSILPYYTFYTLTNNYYQGLFENADTSATRGSINGQVLSGFQIIIPPIDVQRKFNSQIIQIRNELNNLVMQNENLSYTRDRLLSRLMSGKIAVKEMSIEFPPSMKEEATVA